MCFCSTYILCLYQISSKYTHKTNRSKAIFLDIDGAVTRMEEIQRTQSSRRGHRAHLTKLQKRIEDIMSNENPNEMDLAALKGTLQQLQKKKEILVDLDKKIIDGIKDAAELEKEIMDTEDIQSDIGEKIFQVETFLELQQLKNISQPHTEPSESSTHSSENNASITSQAQTQNSQQVDISNENTASQPVSTPEALPSIQQVIASQVPPTTPSNTAHTTQSTSRLPKLSLPTFNGNSLHWQTFWDSFDAAVHSNTSLSRVQKFNYLKAQTSGDAARAIGGFPLTNTNYEQAIILLRERFGQPYKIVNAHMQALLNIASPTTNLTSLRQFYDTIENHIRGLSALGKSEESFASLLIPIILGKLPVDLQRNLARE